MLVLRCRSAAAADWWAELRLVAVVHLPYLRDKTYAGGGGNQCTVRLLGYFRHFVKGFRASSAMAVPSAPSGRTIPQTKYAARFRPYLEKLRMWYQISSLEDELVGR